MIPVGECVIFSAAFAASAAAPGPETAALMGRALIRGMSGSVPLAVGITIGKLLMLAAAVAGVAALVAALGPIFVAARICGGLYFLWLGVRKWRRAGRISPDRETAGRVETVSDVGVGLGMTLSNPIAIAFYVALLPGVIDVSHIRLTDYLVLAALVVGVLSIVVCGYCLTAQVARRLLSATASRTWLGKTSAAMYAAAGLWILLR